MKPTTFKNKMVKINSLINLIPDAEDHDVFSDPEMKNMVFNAMPKSWRKRFQEVRRRSTTETLDNIAAFFDMHFKEEQHGIASSQNNNNCRNNDRNGRCNDGNDRQRNGSNQRQGESNGARNNGNRRHNDRNNRARDNHCNDNAQEATRSARSQGNRPADDNSVGTERTTATTESDPYSDNFAYEKEATLKDDNMPMTYITAKSKENSHTFKKVLFNSGGTYFSIMCSSVPHGTSLQSAKPKRLLSAAGLTMHDQVVKFDTMKFPEFSAAITVKDVNLLGMDDHGQKSYDIIIGRDLMKELKMLIDFDAEEVTFKDQAIPFQTRDQPVQDAHLANEPESDSDSNSNIDVLPPLIHYWDPDSSNNKSDDKSKPEEVNNNFLPMKLPLLKLLELLL